MKNIAQLFLFFGIVSLLFSNTSCLNKNRSDFSNILVSDSGLILFKDAKQLIMKLNKGINLKKLDIGQNDTIGKYYKKENSYILCLENLADTIRTSQIIAEIDSKGIIKKSEIYGGPMYNCCWKNKADGFGKVKNYFYLKSCGTGSAFCATELYFFKEILPQDDTNPIIKDVFSGMCEIENDSILACILDSNFEIRSNSILFHYIYEKGISDDRKRIRKTEKLDVEYFLKDNYWFAKDSTKLKEILY